MASRPALVLMGLGLPGTDGLTATRQFKPHPATHEIPVVALTASAMDEDAAKAKEAGCDGCVKKPCEKVRLLKGVRRAIGRRSAGSVASVSDPSPPLG